MPIKADTVKTCAEAAENPGFGDETITPIVPYEATAEVSVEQVS